MLCVCSVFVDIIVHARQPVIFAKHFVPNFQKEQPLTCPSLPPAKTRMKMLTTVTAMKALPHTQLDNQQTSFDSVRWIKR